MLGFRVEFAVPTATFTAGLLANGPPNYLFLLFYPSPRRRLLDAHSDRALRASSCHEMLNGLAELNLIARADHDLDDLNILWTTTSNDTNSSPPNSDPSHVSTNTNAQSTMPASGTPHSAFSTSPINSTPVPASGSGSASVGHSSGASASSSAVSAPSASTSGLLTTITSAVPTTITSGSSTFTTSFTTTITTSAGFMSSSTPSPKGGSLSVNSQPVCLGDGIDVSAVGLLSTIIIPSVVGLAIWLIFAFLRPRFRQVYGVREWFPPQDLRPRPLNDTFWAFLFPHVPFVPSVPDRSDLSDAGAEEIPSDSQLSQRVLWIALMIVLGWSLIGLAGALPLYLVNTPCLANSTPQASFGGLYSTLQDLSLLRLLQFIPNSDGSSSSKTLVRRVQDGVGIPKNIRIRIIILTVFVIVLAVLPAVYKLMKEFTRLANYRKHWLEIRCEEMDLGWLSARDAPGFVGWGEKQIKDFIIKSGLSMSLDRSGGIGVSGSMAGVGSGFRARTQSQRSRNRDEAERPLNDDEKARPEVDIAGLFSISDTGELAPLIEERDRILNHLEVAEARYIASFRLSTPEPSMAELPAAPEDENNLKKQISRSKALTGYSHLRNQRGRRTTSSSLSTPTSYVAPSQYYKLRGVRGISGGRLNSLSGSSHGGGPSFAETVRSRIVGTRFQERDSVALGGRLPIGSRVTMDRALPDIPSGDFSHMEVPRATPGADVETETAPLTGSEDPNDPMTPRIVSAVDDDYQYVHDYGSSQIHDSPEYGGTLVTASAPPGHSRYGTEETPSAAQQYSNERRESFPMRIARGDGDLQESHVPLHLRLQPQGPFVRPLSGLDHEDLGVVYSDIRECRTRLKQINNDISEAQNDCYNDIADGARVKGWLIAGRGVRFLPGIQLIEGRSKNDIHWDELQRQGGMEGRVLFWTFVAMVAIVLAAALVAVSGLAVSTAPNVVHYLPFFGPLVNSDDKIGAGVATTLASAVAATVFFAIAIAAIHRSSRYSGAISLSSAQLMSYKAVFFVLTVVGAMWFTAVGALVFSMNALALGTDRASSVANGSIYMSAFFLALVFNVAILAPGLLLLQPGRLRRVLTRERHSITPRERFRALYPRSYDPTYATACCILAVILASTFSLIFPLIGPAVVLLLFLTIIAHRFLVGYVYGRTEAQTGGLLQIWLLKRFATVVAFQPILLGLIFLSRRIFIEGGILAGVGVVAIIFVEVYAKWKTKLPGKSTLSTVTLDALETFEERASTVNGQGDDSEAASVASPPRMRQRGSMASVLEMMSLTLAVMPSSQQNRGAVPLDTESLDDLTATERAARTHPDAPPHLPPLAFADHAEEMSGILYAPELLAPQPIIWLPNDSAGIARSEAYDLQRYHNLRTTLDVRSHEDVLPRRSSSSRRRAVS